MAPGLLGLPTKSNAQLDAEANAALAPPIAAQPNISGLAAYVDRCFEEASLHKAAYITPKLERCKRQRRGEYEPDVLSKIQEYGGGSTRYFNETATKCLSLEAWLRDVLIPIMDKLFQLDPTPIPTLPEDVKLQVIEAVRRSALASGIQNDPIAVQQLTLDMADKALLALYSEAEKRVKRMETTIHDQCDEGGFSAALAGFIKDFCVYPYAIFKGPVITSQKRVSFKGAAKTEVKITPTWACVSPKDCFFAPAARNIQEDYVIETVYFRPRQLMDMRGVDGWDTDAIDAVLASKDTTSLANVQGDAERAQMNYRNPWANTSTATGIEFWGSVQGKDLLESKFTPPEGMDIVPDDYYPVRVIKIGTHVVHAILNPDPLGSNPYYVASYDYEDSDSGIVGESLPERMRDCQDTINAAGRNLMNNMAMSALPQIGIDIDALAPGENANSFSGRVWQYNGRKMNTAREPIQFYQPPSNARTLQEIMQLFSDKSDERTQVPKYAYGNSDVQGAGATASGLSMLLNNLTKGIKRMLAEIETFVIIPAIRAIYNWNMLYLNDPSIQGDAQIVPRGILAVLVKEQLQVRRQEFIQLVSKSDMALEIIGIDGYAELLRGIAAELVHNVSDIVPDKEVLRQRVQNMMKLQQPPAAPTEPQQGNTTPPGPPAAPPMPMGQPAQEGMTYAV